MSQKKEETIREFREYCLKYYGNVPEQYERFAKYTPDIITSWINFRKTTWKKPEDGGHLPIKFKELLAVGIETATMKQDVGHVETAIDAGATVEEIAEVLGICIMLTGMETYMTGGRAVLERAEKYAKKLGKL